MTDKFSIILTIEAVLGVILLLVGPAVLLWAASEYSHLGLIAMLCGLAFLAIAATGYMNKLKPPPRP